MNSDYSVSDYQSKLAQSTLIKNVYLWMTAALAITGITAMAVSNSYAMQQLIF